MEQKRSIRRTWALVRQQRAFYLFLLPGFVLVMLFSYLPLYGLVGAFQAYNPFKGFFASPWVGLKNFRVLFVLPDFRQVLFNTINIGFWNFLFGFPAPIVLAILLNEIRSAPFKKINQTISHIPNFISWVVASGIFYKMLAADGVVNGLLAALGVGGPIYFFNEPRYFVALTVVTSLWKGVGFGSILYLAVLTSIDPGLYEASEIDGAGKMKQIRYITLPGILPTITLMLVLSLSNILNVSFDQVYTMQNTMNLSASDVLDTYIFRIAMNGMITDYSRGIAMGLFRAVICLILFGTANFASRRLGSGSVF
ncbi:MAG: sugar ABC transporter permease [Clostridiales bacterium]|nr:sugar ABC transporter permease [Clostridiales bacterium]